MTTPKRSTSTPRRAARAADRPGSEVDGPAETGSAATGPDVLADDQATGTADFVTFVVDGETYAFPMESVEEIIRMPATVRVPLGPPSLAGLANLRGRVLPVVSLRACCGLEPAEVDDATRVVVVDGGATLGFVVDRVSSVTSVDVSRVEPAAGIAAAVDGDLVSGIIKADGDGGLVKVLDVHRLVQGQFEALAGHTEARASARTGARPDAAAGRDADDADDTLEFVSFTVDGQEYALHIDRVQEIVQAPERVTSVPNAEQHVLGVMDLRGGLLPVVSLRRVFGLDAGRLSPDNRIVVVQLPRATGESAGSLVGVVMDTVREVLRVPRDVVTELPDFMARAGRARDVESVCRLEGGTRLVSVLSLDQLFGKPGLRDAVLDAVASAGGPDAPDLQEDVVPEADTDRPDPDHADAVVAAADEDGDELLVVFRLGDEEYAVDVDRVQEIIRVPETLIRVPQALDFVEGLVNLRGSVLPVVDLRTRLGLHRADRDERQRIVVLTVDGVRTGFVVDSVAEVLPVTRDLLEPAPEMSAEQARLITGVANLTAAGRMLLLLETEQLLATEQLAALVPHQRQAAEQLVQVG
jgi:purine-binding chemotaxis protein CheW